MRSRRDQNLAAKMAALLFRCELVFEMHARSARLDKCLHDFKSVERPAKTGFRVSDNRREPGVNRQALAFRGFDLVGALQGLVDALAQFRCGVGGVERLVGIHGGRGVGVRCDLPAGQVNRLEASADHLHGLITRQGAERVDEILLVNELPQTVRAHFGKGLAHLHRAAQLFDIGGRIGPLNAVKAAFGGGGDEVVKIGHI